MLIKLHNLYSYLLSKYLKFRYGNLDKMPEPYYITLSDYIMYAPVRLITLNRYSIEFSFKSRVFKITYKDGSGFTLNDDQFIIPSTLLKHLDNLLQG